MDSEKLRDIGSLKFQEKIIVNKKILYRSYGPRDINIQNNYWEYEFYTEWNKRKNLLPIPSHVIKIYTSFKKIIENGKEIFKVNKYIKGVLKDLQTNIEERITSVSK